MSSSSSAIQLDKMALALVGLNCENMLLVKKKLIVKKIEFLPKVSC